MYKSLGNGDCEPIYGSLWVISLDCSETKFSLSKKHNGFWCFKGNIEDIIMG
jgi:hypothetical protein